MIENPIVDEVHRVRLKMLDEYKGDLSALLRDAQRRTDEAARAGRKVYAPPPRKPQPQPAIAKRAG